MGLSLNRDKTRVVRVATDGSGKFDFLGFTFQQVRSYRVPGTRYLAARPSRKSLLRLHERVRGITAKHWGYIPPQVIVEWMNKYLRGWAGYFGRFNRGHVFSKVDFFVTKRLISHFKRRSHKGIRPPEGMTWYYFLVDHLGLNLVSGTPPTANRRR